MRRICSLVEVARYRWLVLLPLAAACKDEAPASVDTTADTGIDSLSAGEESSSSSADTSGDTASPAECNDGVQNGDETDLDCGGSCDGCADGLSCLIGDDCLSLVCEGEECQSATCYDQVQNGVEEGVDCGDACPNACGQTGECEADDDCRVGEFCNVDVCDPSSCENRLQDTRETDVDCGGTDCPDCVDGLACLIDGDCISHVCDPKTQTCAAPTCDDGEINGDETDEDCGGGCPACPNSSSCELNADCLSGICEGGNCQAPGCNDGVLNGDETDEDCGGSCADCDDGEGCLVANDCTSGVCQDLICAAPTCDDGVFNGDETDEDCGGACGATCTTGQDCFDAGDCVQGVCEFTQCSAPDCLDGIQNGDETDTDCGGSCGASCEVGEQCIDGGDCSGLVCEMNLCSAPDCFDLIENSDETDVDCGGTCGATCDTGQQCIDADDCISSVCVLNTCQAASCSDGVLNGNEVGIDCGGDCSDPCDIGGEQSVNTYVADLQLAPAIAAAPDGSYFVIVWVSSPFAEAAQDGSGSGVYGQRFDSDGQPAGAEFLVNTTTSGTQSNPAIAAYDGGFVVTWESPDADSGGVFAKQYDATGAVVTDEFQVNDSSVGLQRRPDVAADNGGAFVICFEDRPTTTFDVLCRRYDASAAPQAIASTVNETTSGDQLLPSVGRAATGAFTVVWQGANDQDGSGMGVYMRRFNNAGTALTSEAQVNETTDLNQQQATISVNAAGAFVITWSSDGQDASSTGVVARRYDATGAALAGEFLVNTYTTGAQNNPAVGVNANGDFIVTWVSANQDGNLTGVFAQRYTSAGVVVGDEFRVNTTTANFQEEPEVALRDPDEPIIVYTSGSVTDRDVVFRRFTAAFP